MKALAILALFPITILAVPGDRCAKGYGADCICLTTETCDQYRGKSIVGSPGKYPCPNDPDHVIGCVVAPCKNRTDNTQCLWREACENEMPVAACPGGKDFICCNHHLNTSRSSTRETTTSTVAATTTSGDEETATTETTSEKQETSTDGDASRTRTSGASSTSRTSGTSGASQTAGTTAATTSAAPTATPTTTQSTAVAAVNGVAISELLGGLAAVFAALL